MREKYKKLIFSLKTLILNISEHNRKIYIYATIIMFSNTLYETILVLMPKYIIKLGEKSNYNIKQILMTVLILFIVSAVCGYLRNSFIGKVKSAFTYLRIDYLKTAFNKILTVDYKYMEDSAFFDRYDSAFDACSSYETGIEQFYNKLLDAAINILILFPMGIIVFECSPLIIIAIVAYVVHMFINKRKVANYKYSLKEKVSHEKRKKNYFHKVTHDFTYGKDIRLFKMSEGIMNKYNEQINKYLSLNNDIEDKSAKTEFITGISFGILEIVVYGALIYKGINGISLADLTTYLFAFTVFKNAFTKLVDDVSIMYDGSNYIYDYFEFIKAKLVSDSGKISADISPMSIELKNVCFSYPNCKKRIFNNLNLNIKAGEKIAIVGSNGAGKSTLVKLIMGLYEVDKGDILLNNRSIKEFRKEELYKMFSAVFQDGYVLAYSIAENIACSSGEINKEYIYQILRDIGLYNKVMEFENNIEQLIYKSINDNGIDLSGGEKQKLLIARAMYKQSSIAVLDEPTSALDALAEENIYRNFNELIGSKTAIFISHRLASTRFCDRIFLLNENGEVEEIGSHNDLMALKGNYYKLFMLQGKYYKEELEKV